MKRPRSEYEWSLAGVFFLFVFSMACLVLLLMQVPNPREAFKPATDVQQNIAREQSAPVPKSEGNAPAFTTPSDPNRAPRSGNWWWLEYGYCKKDDFSPAVAYQLARMGGYSPRIVDHSDEVDVVDEKDASAIRFFRTEEACQNVVQAKNDAAQAEQRKLDQYLKPYQ